MLFSLAIIPSIALIVFIYKLDKKEKEPIKFLWKLFLFGIVLVIPAIIIETVLDEIICVILTPGSIVYAFFEGFIVAACTEELGKYFFLKIKSWDSKYFDCMFDGIVYAVFVSLGFATVENIMYVFDDGIGVAIMRMFTSVPGHVCFAIIMGHFYSKARLAINRGDIAECKTNKRKAVLVPILLHGVYDFLIMMDSETAGDGITVLAFLTWVVFVIAMFVKVFILVFSASKNDEYIVRYEIGWKCACGRQCFGNFCANCGRKKPEEVVLRESAVDIK